MPVLKTVRMPSALSASEAATLASKSSSCVTWLGLGLGLRLGLGLGLRLELDNLSRVTVALGPLRWQRPPRAFPVSARLKPASA